MYLITRSLPEKVLVRKKVYIILRSKHLKKQSKAVQIKKQRRKMVLVRVQEIIWQDKYSNTKCGHKFETGAV